MGIQINGQTDTVTAIDGSITVGTDLTVPGVLTYDDVTNIDSVGVITARSGVHVTSGSVGIGTDNPATNFKLDVNGDLSLGELGGTNNTFIDQKQEGHLDIINSGRSANNGRVRINKTNSIGGDTTYFRDFEVYDGKDKLLFLIDGSEGRIGIGTDTFNDAAEVMRVQAAEGQSNTLFTIKANSTSGSSILNFGDDDFNEGRIIYQHSDNTMRFRTDDTERVSIGSSELYTSGFMRSGNRPYMQANSNPTVDSGEDVIVKSFGNVTQNSNFNSYNNSTGIYTCPIDGLYATSAGLWVDNVPSLASSNTFMIIEQKRNGSIVSAGSAGANAGQEHATMNVSAIFNCLAGDTIHLLASNLTRKSSTPRNYFNIAFIG
jgi:hypothetical protein